MKRPPCSSKFSAIPLCMVGWIQLQQNFTSFGAALDPDGSKLLRAKTGQRCCPTAAAEALHRGNCFSGAGTARAARGLVNKLCPAQMPPTATVEWPPGLLLLKSCKIRIPAWE